MSSMNGESEGTKPGRLLRYIARQLLHYTLEALKRVWLLAIGVLVILGVAYLVRNWLDEAMQSHWLYGLILSVFIFCLLLFLIWVFWRQPKSETDFSKYSLQGLVLSLILVILVAIEVMAAISYILYEADLIHYTSSYPITSSRLLDYYGWHFIDSIPVLEIWSTFNVDAPVKGEGLWAGILVMVFRVLIVAPGIAVIKNYLGRRGKTNPSPAVEPSH
jgi:cbb3-type cytochrome oxidase subunit 3